MTRVFAVPQVEAEATLDEGSRRLTLRGYEISVVYFRAGYTPTDYHGDAEWLARLKMERSAAVKCPTVAYQCVGAKKIQQVLPRPFGLVALLHACCECVCYQCLSGRRGPAQKWAEVKRTEKSLLVSVFVSPEVVAILGAGAAWGDGEVCRRQDGQEDQGQLCRCVFDE